MPAIAQGWPPSAGVSPTEVPVHPLQLLLSPFMSVMMVRPFIIIEPKYLWDLNRFTHLRNKRGVK